MARSLPRPVRSRFSKIVAVAGLASAVSVAAAAPVNGSVDGKTYDYVIVGGGLSGLVAANRLSEDSNGKSPGHPPASCHPNTAM